MEAASVASGSTKSETELDLDEAKSTVPDDRVSEPPTEATIEDKEVPKPMKDVQKWRWERQWVDVERSFVAPLKLKKWVRVPDEENRTVKNRPVTVETGKDGTKMFVGGFREYICSHPGCGKVFPTPASLRKHQHIHGEKQFVCDRCGKRFLDNSKLKRHIAIHDRDT